MAQPQPQVPQRTFSPTTQLSLSPSPHTAGFTGQPPAKKQRLSPAPSPQGVAQSPGAMFSPMAMNNAQSPATPSTPNSLASPVPTPSAPPLPLPTPAMQSTTASPVPTPSNLPGHFNGNGNSPQKLQLPAMSPGPQAFSPKPYQTPTPPTPTGPGTPSGMALPHLGAANTPGAMSNGNVFMPIAAAPIVQTPTGVMGPPSKPAERPTKEYQYDVDDSLAGTGIDLRQEEQFQADYFAGTYRPEARTGFPANAPGGRSSFYGALSANQPAETVDEANQRKFELEAAKQAWTDASRTLAISRSNALRNRFLEFNTLHYRADKIAKEYGLSIVLDAKTAATSTRTRQEPEIPKPTLAVKTAVGPDGVAFVSTVSSAIPEDTYLADQLALLSLATKHRLRELLEDANKIATTRQTTSHGVVPDDWLEAASPLPPAGAVANGANITGEGRAALKRPAETEAPEHLNEVAKKIAGANTLIQSLRVVGKSERSVEEQRLLKRQKREEKKTDPTAGTPAPARTAGTTGIPGSVAPEPDKAPTKKEMKKNAAAKVAEQNDTMSANRTSMAFLGGRKKQYSWLSGGGGASPKRGMGGAGGGGGGSGNTGGVPGQGGGGSGAHTPGRRTGTGPVMLTGEGRTKWGSWREDGIKGKDIQLRDLVLALEADGRERVALQAAYNRLDRMPAASKSE